MINTIIFDLGGVLIDIDYSKTKDKFKILIDEFKTEIPSISKIGEINKKYEIGAITDEEFRRLYYDCFGFSLSDIVFDFGWNALLRDFNETGINLIKKLKKEYRICLLSNTNNIHYKYCNKRLKDENLADGFNELFDLIFLSYRLKMKKPDLSIYQHVIKELNVLSNEILLIDDLSVNTDAAKKTGMNIIHLTDNKTIETEVLNFLQTCNS